MLPFESDKNQEIIDVLARLQQMFGEGCFDIVDHWDADLNAIGIANPADHGRLAYIAINNDHPNGYFVELELPPSPESDLPYCIAGNFEDIDFEQLASVVGRHLGLVFLADTAES